MRGLFIAAITILTFPIFCQTIYRTACQGDHTRLDSMLMDQDINIQDPRGRTLAHWAVACRQTSVLDDLIAKQIDLLILDNDGASPLELAIRYKNEKLYHHLIQEMSGLDWQKTIGGTLMEQAVLNSDTLAIDALITNAISVDILNERGSTALDMATRMKLPIIQQYLISRGASEEKIRNMQVTDHFMGQAYPDSVPRIFAPNFISTEAHEFGSVMSKDGQEFYFGVDVRGKNEIRYSRLHQGRWTQPETILRHDLYSYNDPFLSPDEQRLYFISNQSFDGVSEPKDIDIWYIEKEGDKWSRPLNAGPNINTLGEEYYISFTSDGTMYFASDILTIDSDDRNHDIFYARLFGDTFQSPVRLSDNINTSSYEADVFVDPEERYLIFCAQRPEGYGRGDLYISFRKGDRTWSLAKNLGPIINTVHHELCPYVSSDGEYLFYTSRGDIYWISMGEVLQLED